MRKSYFLPLSAMALIAVGCTNEMDAPVPDSGNEAEVSFTLEVPSIIQTYAYGDGTTVERLHYAVYEHSANGAVSAPVISGTVDNAFAGATKVYTQKFKVITGVTYDFVFFADDENSPYEFDFATATITDTEAIADGKITGNKEERDAFFGVLTYKVTETFSQGVELKRPFAQINLGTNDLNEDIVRNKFGNDLENLFTSVETQTYSSLNLLTNEVSGQVSVTFEKSSVPQGEEFRIKGYDYLSMNYLLMPGELVRQNCVFTIYNGNDEVRNFTVPNLPVQRNYRTNVYGTLLTTDGEVKVEIISGFDGDHSYEQEIAPGLFYNSESKTYSAESAEGLIALTESIQNESFEKNSSIVLNADIDMEGQTLTMVKGWNKDKPTSFDGNGHTIKNIVFDKENSSIFESFIGPIKNLTVDGMVCDASVRNAGLFANVYGDIENVHVKNVTINSTEGRVGAIVGIHNSGSMRNCSVENVEIVGGWSVGGMIGAINETPATNRRAYENLVVKNVKVSTTGAWGEYYDKVIGLLVGDINVQGVEFVNCSIEECDFDLPLYHSCSDYIWNGTPVQADLD